MVAMRGVKTSDPINAYGHGYGNSTAYASLTITTDRNGCMIINGIGFSQGTGEDYTNLDGVSNANMQSVTEACDHVYYYTSASSVGVVINYGILPNAGSSGSITGTWDYTYPTAYIDFMVALNPA